MACACVHVHVRVCVLRSDVQKDVTDGVTALWSRRVPGAVRVSAAPLSRGGLRSGGGSQRGERGGSARSRGAAGLVTDQAQREAGGLQDTWLQRRALPRRPPEPGSGFSPQGPRGRSAAAASSSTLPATSRGSSVSEQPRVPGCVSAPGTRAGRRSQAGRAGRGRRPAAARRGPRDSAL